MAPKSENIFVRAKAYQRLHPRTPWADCIQKVKGKKTVSGVRKPKTAVGRTTVKRKRLTGSKHVATSTVGRVTRKRSIGALDKGEKLCRDIEKLELKRRDEKRKEMRDLIQLEINALHDDLDALKSKYKRKSA